MLTETTKECAKVVFTVRVEPDYSTHTGDFDCYTPKQVAAFDRGEWGFVGIIPAVEITDGMATVTIECPSLWGIEYGDIPYTDDDDNLVERPESYDQNAYLAECARECMTEAEQTLRRFSLRVEDLPAPTFVWGV